MTGRCDPQVAICFDDESKIRVLSPEKFRHTEELAENCTAFVNSTIQPCVCRARR